MHRVSSGSTGRLDAAIVGGGLIGAMVAFDLASAVMRVVLLERKPGLCMEASCTNTGALMVQPIRAAFIPRALRTIELWRTAPEWLGADVGYVRNGGLTVAYDDDEAQKLEGWMDDRRAAGAPAEIISRERARVLEPALTDRIALASYCELDGFADAKLTGAGCCRGLARARVDVRAPVAVSGIEREEHGFAIIHEAGTVRSSRVILAGGVWLGEMSGWLGMPLPVECRVKKVLGDRVALQAHVVRRRDHDTVAAGFLRRLRLVDDLGGDDVARAPDHRHAARGNLDRTLEHADLLLARERPVLPGVAADDEPARDFGDHDLEVPRELRIVDCAVLRERRDRGGEAAAPVDLAVVHRLLPHRFGACVPVVRKADRPRWWCGTSAAVR